MIHIETIEPKRGQLRRFMHLPFTLYEGDPNYVPPLLFEQKATLKGRHNMLFANGIQRFFMAYEDGKPIGRLLAGIDEKVIERTGIHQSYLSLFECTDNQEAANRLFDAARDFLKPHGITRMIGPNPATFDDFNKGMLIDGFDGPPVLFNPYNPPYYVRLFEQAGFRKHKDHFAYFFDLKETNLERLAPLVEKAQQRYGFYMVNPDLSKKGLPKTAADIATIVSESFPDDWEILPPTTEDIFSEFKQLKTFIDPKYLVLAYATDGRPIGMILALPDYNILIKRMKGRLFPTGIFHFLTGRKKLDQLRAVMQFVIPEYQNKAVNGLMFYKAFLEGQKHGARFVEGSTIDETNIQAQLATEKMGGKLYRTYRQYEKDI